MKPSVTGKRYFAEPIEVSRSASMFYALAVGDENPAYLDDRTTGGIIAPPMAAALWARGALKAVLHDPEADIRYDQLLHFSQSFQWETPVRPGDHLATRAKALAVEQYESGSLIRIETVSTNQEEAVTARGEWVFMDRSAGLAGGGKPPRAPAPEGPVSTEETLLVSRAQTFVYAEASGDKNPLHLDDAHAKARGLPGIILHGLCTMALCHRAVTRTIGHGDPARIRSLAVRFARPVFPGSRITFKTISSTGPAVSTSVPIIATDDRGNEVLKEARCTAI